MPASMEAAATSEATVLSSRWRSAVIPRLRAKTSRATAERAAASKGCVMPEPRTMAGDLAGDAVDAARARPADVELEVACRSRARPSTRDTATRSGCPPRASMRSFFADAEPGERGAERQRDRLGHDDEELGDGAAVVRVGDLGEARGRRARSAGARRRGRRAWRARRRSAAVFLPSATSAAERRLPEAGVLVELGDLGEQRRRGRRRPGSARGRRGASAWRGRASPA